MAENWDNNVLHDFPFKLQVRVRSRDCLRRCLHLHASGFTTTDAECVTADAYKTACYIDKLIAHQYTNHRAANHSDTHTSG